MNEQQKHDLKCALNSGIFWSLDSLENFEFVDSIDCAAVMKKLMEERQGDVEKLVMEFTGKLLKLL